MQRWVCDEYGAPDTLRLETFQPDAPGPGEVTIRVAAAGVGFVDGLLIAGKYQVKPPLPYRPGSEFAGTITALGDGVTGHKVGDHVMGLAPNAAYADALTIASRTAS